MGYGASCKCRRSRCVYGSKPNRCSPSNITAVLYFDVATCFGAGLRRGLRPLVCRDCGFESRQRHGCLSVVSAVCCQVEFSATR